MTQVITRPRHTGGPLVTTRPAVVADPLRSLYARIAAWAGSHLESLVYVTVILAVCGTIRVWNISGSPGAWNDDEGTYVSQAWAIIHDGKLAHYTYWYDHPPFGWMQIAGWAWLTNAFGRNAVAIMVGRELIAVYTMLSGVLLYALARKLGIRRAFAGIGAALLLLSPIAQAYGSMVYLDSLAVPWVLGAMLLASYTDRNRRYALLAGIAMAGAVLTKETMAVFIPSVLWMTAQNSVAGMRLRNMRDSVAVFGSIVFIGYVLLAILKGELIPGKGHVSLGYSIMWQLLGRQSSGSVFDPSTLAHQWFARWTEQDPYLLTFGGLALVVLIAVRPGWLKSRTRLLAAVNSKKMWPIALVALIHIGLLLRPGYLPIPFVVILVPIAALAIGGGLNALYDGWLGGMWRTRVLRVLAVVATGMMIVTIAPTWSSATVKNLTDDSMVNERGAVNWITANVPASEHKQIIVDDNIWPDLINRGYERTNVDWLFKLDVDPAITPRYIPKGGTMADSWKSIDYIVMPPLDATVIASRPTLKKALAHATAVAKFEAQTPGSYIVYKVDHSGTEGEK